MPTQDTLYVVRAVVCQIKIIITIIATLVASRLRTNYFSKYFKAISWTLNSDVSRLRSTVSPPKPSDGDCYKSRPMQFLERFQQQYVFFGGKQIPTTPLELKRSILIEFVVIVLLVSKFRPIHCELYSFFFFLLDIGECQPDALRLHHWRRIVCQDWIITFIFHGSYLSFN